MRVEILVNGTLLMEGTQEPFSISWNTTSLVDGSTHILTARAYDEADNMGESDPITVTIDQTDAYPTPLEIISISYDLEGMIIVWDQSQDNDFDKYELYHTLDTNSAILLTSIEQVEQTSFTLAEFSPGSENWFQVVACDTWGLSKTGPWKTHIPDAVPIAASFDPVERGIASINLRWSRNPDTDFAAYEIYFANVVEMSPNALVGTITEIGDTLLSITELAGPLFYQVVTRDIWGLTSNSEVLDASVTGGAFMTTFGDADKGEEAQSVRQTVDGGYILAGQRHTIGFNDYDGLVIKTNSSGDEIWINTYGGDQLDHIYDINLCNDDGYIFTGTSKSYGGHGEDVWLVKINSSGTEEWNTSFDGGWDSDYGYSVQQTSEGGFVVMGRSANSANESHDYWIIKTNASGTEEWNKLFGDAVAQMGNGGLQTSDGGYIISGTHSPSGTVMPDIWLVKTDASGTEEWSQSFDGGNYDWGHSCQETSDGGFILSGLTTSGGEGAWLVKTDANGNQEWQRVIAGGQDIRSESFSALQTTDGGYILTGTISYRGIGSSSEQLLIVKTDASGTEAWRRVLEGEQPDRGRCVQETSDGGFIVAGTTSSYGAGYDDVWLIKMKAHGNTVYSDFLD